MLAALLQCCLLVAAHHSCVYDTCSRFGIIILDRHAACCTAYIVSYSQITSVIHPATTTTLSIANLKPQADEHLVLLPFCVHTHRASAQINSCPGGMAPVGGLIGVGPACVNAQDLVNLCTNNQANCCAVGPSEWQRCTQHACSYLSMCYSAYIMHKLADIQTVAPACVYVNTHTRVSSMFSTCYLVFPQCSTSVQHSLHKQRHRVHAWTTT